MKRKVKRPFDNEQFRKGYVAGMFAAEKELNTELLHFAEKAHKIMSEGTFPDYGIKINFKDANNTIATNLDMKTEEKAKRYDEALNWMRELYPGLHGATKEDAEHYFPKLKESEESKDERIRKAIVELVKRTPSSMFDVDTVGKWIGASHDEILTYLEKQKEQKPVDDKAFEEWIDGWYNEHHRDGYITMDEREFKNFCRGIRNMYQQKPAEWSEEDEAMIDDIIFSLPRMANGSIEILPSVAKSYSDRLKSLKDRGNFPKSNTNSPSEWSEEKEKAVDSYVDEIIKWEDAHKDWDRQVIRATAYHFFNFQPKQEWSEEDEAHLKWLCRIIHSRRLHGELSLKEESELGKWIDKWINHEPQHEKKWSEFDEDCLKRAIWYVENPSPSVVKDTNLVLWLKSLPGRFNLQPQPKQKDEYKHTGWVARDKEYNSDSGLGLVLFKEKPRRSCDSWIGAIASLQLAWEAFPDLKWEDEPMEVEITIRKK